MNASAQKKKLKTLLLTRIAAIPRFEEYISFKHIPLESSYPPARHKPHLNISEEKSIYFYFGACRYILPMLKDMKFNRAVGMFFEGDILIKKCEKTKYLPFDSGAGFDGRYLPHIKASEVDSFKRELKSIVPVKNKMIHCFGTRSQYLKAKHKPNFQPKGPNDDKLLALFNAVPGANTDERGKTFELIFNTAISLENLTLLILPEFSSKSINIAYIKSISPNCEIRVYNDIIDPSPASDTKAIEAELFSFYKQKGYL